MELRKNPTFFILFLSLSLVLLNLTEAVCRPKNSASKLVPGQDDHAKSPAPSPKAAPSLTPPPPPTPTTSPPLSKAASPPPKSSPSPTQSPPPPSQKYSPPPPPKVTPPPPAPVSSPPTPKATPPPGEDVAAPPSKGGYLLPSVAIAKLKMLCTQVTSYPDLCMTTFTQYLPANPNLDDRLFLFKTAVQIAVNETGALKDLTTSYMGKASSPIMASNLKACLGDFDDALEDIQTAMDAVPSKDYGTLSTFLSSAIDGYADCDDEFRGLNPLMVQTKRLRALVDNCLAFSQKVQWT